MGPNQAPPRGPPAGPAGLVGDHAGPVPAASLCCDIAPFPITLFASTTVGLDGLVWPETLSHQEGVNGQIQSSRGVSGRRFGL